MTVFAKYRLIIGNDLSYNYSTHSDFDLVLFEVDPHSVIQTDDYNGDLIIHLTLNDAMQQVVLEFDENKLDTYMDDYNYQRGKTSSEISAILNPRIQQSIFFYVSLYFVGVSIGYGIYFVIKIIKGIKEKRKTNNG